MGKSHEIVLGLFVLIISMYCCTGNNEGAKNYRIIDNAIVFSEPERAEGQASMLQFASEPIDMVRIGFVGLGMRGPDAVNRMTYIDGVKAVA